MVDIARRAGVSITTVSHVFNETRFVSDEARRRVLDAAAEMSYTPNILARSMRTSTTDMIGLAAPALSKVALGDLVRSIEVEAKSQHLSILFSDTEDDPETERSAIQALHERRVDGIIIAPSAPDSPAVQYLREHAIPTVVVDRFTTGGFDQIGSENIRSTHQLTEHLIVEGGHRRIGLITSMPDLSTMAERVKGYRRALKAHRIPLDPDLVSPGFDNAATVDRALAGFLGLPEPPSAIVSANSSTTISVMRAANTRGLRVPEDLALVGFDDFEWADVFHPRLTVVRQRMEEIGQRAVQLLMRRIADPDAPVSTRRVAGDFIHRDSCGCHLHRPQPAPA